MYQPNPDPELRQARVESRMQRLQEEAEHQRSIAAVRQPKRRTGWLVFGLVALLIIVGIVGYLLLHR